MSRITAPPAPGGVSARCAASGQLVSAPTGTSDHASTNCDDWPGPSVNGDGPGKPLSIPPPGMLIVGIGALLASSSRTVTKPFSVHDSPDAFGSCSVSNSVPAAPSEVPKPAST